VPKRALAAYLTVLTILCVAVIGGARLLGRQGAYLVQLYMLTPALAAVITRLFFYQPRFRDAGLGLGRARDYLKFWLISLGIVALYFGGYTLSGAITWDLSGRTFLDRLAEQFEAAGQDMLAGLPPGFTPQTMLLVYFVGGLTVFNILPGIITGFGEEFGHRGMMFPLLYRIRPWIAFVLGGLIWFAWHLPLALVGPQTGPPLSASLSILNLMVLAIGSICTFTYLSYVYIRSRSIFVASVSHIAMNNASMSLSYFVVVQAQLVANLVTVLVMALLVAALQLLGELGVFREYFDKVLPQGVPAEGRQ